MRHWLISALALALAGCGGGEDVANNSVAPSPTPTPGPMLGGVGLDKPLHVSGPAGGWSIYVAPGTIAFTEKPGAAPVDFYPVSPKLAGDTARIETQTPDAAPVTITLTARSCKAGAKDLPLTAEARIGGRTLKGCAGPGAYDWAKPTPAPSADASNRAAPEAGNTAEAQAR